jgi:hypothetical protein
MMVVVGGGRQIREGEEDGVDGFEAMLLLIS